MKRFSLVYSGTDGRTIDRFETLQELQTAVKAQWEGTDYIDSPAEFHTDYGRFAIGGATLYDLGQRDGKAGTDEWYDWTWKDLAAFTPARLNPITL